MYLFFDQGDAAESLRGNSAGLLIMQPDNSLSPPLPSPNHPMILPSATAGDGSHDWHRPEYHLPSIRLHTSSRQPSVHNAHGRGTLQHHQVAHGPMKKVMSLCRLVDNILDTSRPAVYK